MVANLKVVLNESTTVISFNTIHSYHEVSIFNK